MNSDATCSRCKARFLHHGARKNHEKYCTANFDESPIKFADPDTLINTSSTPTDEEMLELSQRNLELSFGAHNDSAIEFEPGYACSLAEVPDASELFSSFSSEIKMEHKSLDLSLPSLLSPEACILTEKCIESVGEISTVMKKKLKANGLRSKLELELLNFVGTRMLPQTVGDGMVSMLHRTGVTSSKEFECRYV